MKIEMMKPYTKYEVFRQDKPDLLFPGESVSKRKTYVTSFDTEQEARDYAAQTENVWFKYGVRERVFRFTRRDGFARNRHTGELFPVHDIPVTETISLKTLGA